MAQIKLHCTELNLTEFSRILIWVSELLLGTVVLQEMSRTFSVTVAFGVSCAVSRTNQKWCFDISIERKARVDKGTQSHRRLFPRQQNIPFFSCLFHMSRERKRLRSHIVTFCEMCHIYYYYFEENSLNSVTDNRPF